MRVIRSFFYRNELVTYDSDGRDFLATWIVSKSIVAACMPDRNRISQNGRVPAHPDVQPGAANWQMFFSGRAMDVNETCSF